MVHFLAMFFTGYAVSSCFCIVYFFWRANAKDDYEPVTDPATKAIMFMLLFILSPLVFVGAICSFMRNKLKTSRKV